jgi:hypothetical protein
MSIRQAVNIDGDGRWTSSRDLNDATVGKTKRTMGCSSQAEGPGGKGVQRSRLRERVLQTGSLF